MERIKQALEQAERDRSQTPKDQKQPPVQGVDGARAEVPEQPAVEIRFKTTRVVDITPDTFEHNRLVAALPDHEMTDAYRILRTRVLQSLNGNHWKSVAVTSPATGSGKTLTAINLAISLAREINRTVLLADFDLRHPSIHRYFGYEPEFGLGDYLYRDAPLERILFSPSIDRLVILPGRESIHNSSETLRSPKMISLVEELKGRYAERIVIFDLPPILAVDDALTFSPYTDAMLMVAENGATQRQDLETALDILKNTPMIGTVLNKSTSANAHYYGKK